MTNKPKENQIISLPIHGLGASGEGVGYFQGFTLFVDGALPGEVVEARITECRKKHGFAELISITKPSPDRVTPPCPLFGKCGGCQLMHLAYPKQLEMKRQKVVDALTRIGKIHDCMVAEIKPSPLSLSYRNKIQLPVKEGKNGLSIGLYAKASHDLIEVDTCLIHCELGETVYKQIKSLIQNSGISPFDAKTGAGELRHVLIKSGVHTQEVLVVLVTNQKKSPALTSLAKEILKSNPAVKGIIHNIHQEKDNVILGDTYHVLEGKSHIREILCNLSFNISAASFFQVNPLQAENLYLKALEFADVKHEETVLDAYCGVGTLSLIFAKKAKKVIGVEYVNEAIEDAIENAKQNGIRNVSFFCAPAEKFIYEKHPPIDILLLNPPRKGCDSSFLEGVKDLNPKKIIYISCDPATLARDLAQLQLSGYKIDQIQPFDMFPQTSHVECVAKLYRK